MNLIICQNYSLAFGRKYFEKTDFSGAAAGVGSKGGGLSEAGLNEGGLGVRCSRHWDNRCNRFRCVFAE